MLGSLWGCSGMAVGSRWDCGGVEVGSRWGRGGVAPGSLRGCCGVLMVGVAVQYFCFIGWEGGRKMFTNLVQFSEV